MRLFAKLFVLLGLCAAVPLGFTAGAVLWRTAALRGELTAASERTGEAREIDLLELRGKKNAIRVFELLGLPGQIPEATLNGYRIYEEGLAAFRRKDWDDAERLFRAALSILGEDKASSVLLQRVLVFRRHPPPADWDGVFRLKRFDD